MTETRVPGALDADFTVVMDGDEVATMLSSLARTRRTFAWKCWDLDAAGLTTTIGASTITLGGLLKHLALVETDWFAVKLRGERYLSPWEEGDWDSGPDWEWRSAADDSPEELYALWKGAVGRADEMIAAALAEGGPGTPGRFTWDDGRTPNLRRMVADVCEEYSRHCGHADLIREVVDGRVGEDPPREFRP
ncbi:DUF664 domain-containing protein [Nocardioides pocheonensis]|nr:DUF664 domain-containing protein [Nocardioides pocheonensis]